MIPGERLRRHGVGAERSARRDPAGVGLTATVAARFQGRPAAAALVVVRERYPVPRRHLRRQPAGDDLPRLGLTSLDRPIDRVVPVRRIARELVGEDPVHHRGVGPGAHVGEEPQPVALDRPAEAGARIPVGAQGRRLGDAKRPQFVVHVVRRGPVARGAVEGGAAEQVAARLRHDVDAGPAGLGLAEAAGDQHLHLIGVGDVVGDVGDAAAAERCRHHQAVGHQPALAAGAAMSGEEHHARRHRRGGGARSGDAADIQRRHRGQRRAVASRRRQRVQRLVVQHHFAPHRLRVDDRRLAGHRHGFFKGADAQLGVHDDHAGPRDVEALPLDGREPGQRKRQHVAAGRQIGDAVLSGPVADDGAALLDERRAGSLDRDSRKHRRGRVADHARDRRLGEHRTGQRQDPRERDHNVQDAAHSEPPQPGGIERCGREATIRPRGTRGATRIGIRDPTSTGVAR